MKLASDVAPPPPRTLGGRFFCGIAALAAALFGLAGGCDKRRARPDAGGSDAAATAPIDVAGDAAPASTAVVRCARDPDAPASVDLSEASAAAYVELRAGKRELLVVSDSGNKGSAILLDPASRATRALVLPLDASASDDVEGAAWLGGKAPHLYTLTSSGAVRRFSPDGAGGLKRDGDAYRVGAPPLSCDALGSVNCGKNYEGLCLRPPSTPRARCAGYAASKAEGRLYCLVLDGDRLVADTIKPPIALALPRQSLSDCAFAAVGGDAGTPATLVITTNVRGGSSTYVVDEGSGALGAVDAPGTANNEAIAIDAAGALTIFMDTSSSPSPLVRYTCEGW